MYIVMSIKSYKLELPLMLLFVLPNLEYLKSAVVAEPLVSFLLTSKLNAHMVEHGPEIDECDVEPPFLNKTLLSTPTN